MLQRVREWLALLLIVLLPFHALGVTVLTKLIAGPGQAPLLQLAIWKEGVLGIILLIACVEYITRLIEVKSLKSIGRHFDVIDVLIAIIIGLSFLVSDFQPEFSVSQFALGVKYDLIPLIALLILRRMHWSAWFKETAFRAILWVGGIVSVYGILSLLLPDSFFYWLGYSDLHSLYVADKPLAAFQQIGGSTLHRVQSTFSGPNQLGIWLLIPIAIAVTGVTLRSLEGSTPAALKRVHASSVLSMTLLALVLIALFLTFSRAAWIGAFVIIVMALYPFVKAHMTRGRLLGSVFVCGALVFTAVALFPTALLRISSTRGHIDRPIEAIGRMIEYPLGMGLGSAGPATNRSADTCVMLRPEDDPSWAKDRADLCVFLGDKQVQPTGRLCDCPFLPENWYLQIGVELGVLGFILYLSLIGLILRRLWVMGYGLWGVGLMFVGVSIAALFLHAWEDAAIAYSVWMLIALGLPVASRR